MSSADTTTPAARELERVRALPEAIVALLPELEGELVGCPEKEIAKIERAHGGSVPAWYRLYLETLGRSFGVVRHFGDTDLKPKGLLKWMRRVEWRSPRYLLVGLADLDSEYHVHVDLGPEGEGVELVSFECPPGPEGVEQTLAMASSFSTYLLAAMANRAEAALAANGSLGARSDATGKLPALGRILHRAGVEEHPLSGTWDKVFVGPRAIAFGCELGGEESLSVSLACVATDEWWELAGRLEHELGLTIVRGPG